MKQWIPRSLRNDGMIGGCDIPAYAVDVTPYVLLSDHQQALAEKDREIANLQTCQCEGCDESLEGEAYCQSCWMKLREAHHALIEEHRAVELALRKRLWIKHGTLRNHVLYGDDGAMDCNTCIRNYQTEGLDTLYQWEMQDGVNYITELDRVMAQTVRFAQVICKGFPAGDAGHKATVFLASPEVQAWREQEGKK